VTIGDLIIVSVLIGSTSISVTGMSSTNVKNWSRAVSAIDATSVNTMEIWTGAATVASSAVVTVTYSGSVASTFCEIDADSLHSSVLGPWGIVTGAGVHDASGTVNNFPTLIASAAGQAYWGILTPQNTPSAGATSGFVYNLLDTNFVITALNVNLAQGSVTPQSNQSPTGTATAIGIIVTPGDPKPSLRVSNNRALQRAASF